MSSTTVNGKSIRIAYKKQKKFLFLWVLLGLAWGQPLAAQGQSHGIYFVSPASDMESPEGQEPNTSISNLESDEPVRTPIQIIETPEFESLASLPPSNPLRKLGRSVGLIKINNQDTCTGFLLGPDLFVTSLHCTVNVLEKPLQPYHFKLYMDYNQAGNWGEVTTTVKEILQQIESLDLLLLRLHKPIGNTYGWLTLAINSPLELGKPISIIQHPNSKEKTLSRRHAEIKKIYDTVLHYTADTEVGSSGAPVFLGETGHVIAIHHAGGQMINEGVLSSAILEKISPFLQP